MATDLVELHSIERAKVAKVASPCMWRYLSACAETQSASLVLFTFGLRLSIETLVAASIVAYVNTFLNEVNGIRPGQEPPACMWHTFYTCVPVCSVLRVEV